MAAVEMVQNLTVVVLVAFGVFFLAVGTVGLLRFPNVYNRMHATSKPTTLGTAPRPTPTTPRRRPNRSG